jgi:DNA-binding NarL/FixJ family response regulator
MNTATRRTPITTGTKQQNELVRGERRGNPLPAEDATRATTNGAAEVRARVYIAAENRLLREALSRMLTRQGDIDVVGFNSTEPFHVEGLIEEKADILLLTSRGSLGEDVFVTRQVRLTAPTVRILLVGMTEDETEFFQYVRAGIRRYLPRDASAEEVLEAMHAVQQAKRCAQGRCAHCCFGFSNQRPPRCIRQLFIPGWA